jgi:hypothetical protein
VALIRGGRVERVNPRSSRTVPKITTTLKIAAALAAGLTITTAHAEPYSLAASCRLTSMLPGAKCMLTGTFLDLGSSVIKRGQVKVDNIVAGQSNNDTLNPLIFSMEGEVQVACGVSHTVTGFIMPQGSTTYTQAGSVPTVPCPKAP